jgi:tetratricopeptide (TPR) repeat protein/predicted O-methyltransferase YrrM
MNNPLVTVIVACFNGVEFLEGCIRSILDQHTSCEIIVVDDGSTDDSVERGRALLNELPVDIFVISQRNGGPAAARNTGIRLARGKYICFLDVDDRYAPGFMACTVPILEKEAAVVAAFCQMELVNAHRSVEPWQRDAMEHTQPCNMLMRTEVVRQIGGFSESPVFRGQAGGEDGAFRTELRRHGKIARIDKPLFKYRVRPASHFDFFLDRSFLENGKIRFRELSKEESDGSLKSAIREYRESVHDRVLASTIETLKKSVGGSFEFERMAQRFASIEGNLHPAEGFTLYSLARRWPVEGMTVEVGSSKGRSTCWLAAGCRDSGSAKVVAISQFTGYSDHQGNGSPATPGSALPIFHRNLEAQKLTEWVNVRVGSAVEASKGWEGPIRLLFIDGHYSGEAVRQDFGSWAQFIAPRGLVVFHDVGVVPDVTQLYSELCTPGSGWKEIARFHTLGILQRAGKEKNQAAKLEAEVARLREILRHHPEQMDSLFHLAQALEKQSQWDEAIATYQRLLQFHPEHAEAHNFLGIQLARQQNFEEATKHFDLFLKLQPGRASGYHNLGVASVDQEKVVEAIPHFDEAIRLDPHHAEAHKGKAMAQLKLGQFTEGWDEYEWRWRCKDLPPLNSQRPLWDGSPLHGRTILLHCEQGMGDSLQFIRYAPLVKEQGARVVLICPPQLIQLFRTCPGIDRLISRSKGVIPPHDVHLPLLSLPRVLRTELTNIPATIPYLHPDPVRVRAWRNELAKVPGFKVGIFWQGNPKHANDANRSIPLSQFQPLADVPGVQLFSLQVGKGHEQLAQLGDKFAVTDLRQKIEKAYTETAAAMKNLDLVICCDTSVAHLAGGLGVPVWVGLPFAADWRWLQHREDSPWYPTMRLFRQQRYKDWPEVFERITAALHVESQKPRPTPEVTTEDTTDADTEGEVYRYSAHPENESAESSPVMTDSPAPAMDSPQDIVLTPDGAPMSPQMVHARKLIQARKLPEAEQLLRQILADNAADADAWFHLALVQQIQNRQTDAMASIGRLLELRPDHAEGQVEMGIILCRLGKLKEGETHLREAIRLRPKLAKAHNNLGVVLTQMGRRAEALACWQQTVKLDPNYPEGHFNLAVALGENKQPEDAEQHYERALELRPNYAEAYSNLGLLRVEQGRPAAAVVLLEHAVRLKPDIVDSYNNLGLALADLGRSEEALACYREALRRRPHSPEVYNNYGTALAAMGRPDEAIACFAQAQRLKPGYPEARWHQALTWLTQGDMTRGWPEYEYRWKRRRSRPRRFKEPLWDGSNLEGKTILVWCEQGLGDSLQFIRYASLVKARGGNVLVECPDKLLAMFFTCAGIDQLVAQQNQLPPFDVQVPLLSLPGIFGTRLHSIPADVPYFSTDEPRVAWWREELARPASPQRKPGELRIGIVWQGNPKHRWDRHRSFALEHFQPIARLASQGASVQLYSLQKGVPAEDLAYFSQRHGLIDLSGRLEDFTDTAAVMKNLDLVITCDSAPAHLAGALGVPVWVALSAMSDWRWLKERDDSPWYPTLRLFRQKKLGDWQEVFGRMTAEVAGLLRK